LRLGAGVRAHFGNSLDMLAIRALLIHCTESSVHPMLEVGRGRVARDLEAIVLCNDETARLVYQGEISPAKFIRAPIPLPAEPLEGMVKLTATLCYTTAVDPHHPGNYTRAGLQPTFRPHSDKRKDPDKQVHADSKGFFGKAEKGLTEEELRRDTLKWENTLHASKGFQAGSLKDPVCDIHYNSLTAPKVADLYDRIVRRYASQIEPLRPVIDIPVRL
jgi:hypothetical protein